MTSVEKGVIVSFQGNFARVKRIAEVKGNSHNLIIPSWLRGDKGKIEVGVEVVFSTFDDHTGIIWSRADGEIFNET